MFREKVERICSPCGKMVNTTGLKFCFRWRIPKLEVSWGIHPIQGICRWGLRSELEFTFMAETSIILVAEDRADDIELIKKALTRARISNPVYFVRDGEETMAYLSGARHYANREEYPFP